MQGISSSSKNGQMAQASRLRSIIADELLQKQPRSSALQIFWNKSKTQHGAQAVHAGKWVTAAQGMDRKDGAGTDIEYALRLIDAVLLRL